MPEPSRKRRIDKDRNRLRLLAAATTAIQAEGIDVSMRAIAKEAGVGIATAYRHFPTKGDLLEAVLAERVEEGIRVLRAALDDTDAWTALTTVIEWFAEVQITYPGLLRALMDVSPGVATFADARQEHSAVLNALVRKAAAQGALADDVSAEDIWVGMMAMTAFAGLPPDRGAIAVRRLRDLIIRVAKA